MMKRGDDMIFIGNHVSVSKGYLAMGRHEQSLGGDTFAFFPRNPRGGKSKAVPEEDVRALRQLLADSRFGKLVVHGAYTMNVCAAKEEVRVHSLEMLRDDLTRLQALPGNLYNFHPGCHTGQGTDTGICQIADAVAAAMQGAEAASGLPLQNTVLLETMAGKGSEIGGTFEELRAILDGVLARGGKAAADRLGVCLDTCHIWDGGYDIRTDLDGVLRAFDRVIGLDRLYAVHLNDSKNGCGSHKDRHEKLGQGCIGADALRAVVRHPLLQGRPFILETPNDDEGYKAEIQTVRGWMTN